MTRDAQGTDTKPARTLKDEWVNSLKGYGITAWLASVFVAYRALTEAEIGNWEGVAVLYIFLGLPIWFAIDAAIWLAVAAYRRLARKMRGET